MGKEDGAKTLRKTYPDESSARRAALAERDRLKRAPATLDMKLALRRPNASPECRVTASGFKAEIDATTWLIVGATHHLDKEGGYVTGIKIKLSQYIL